MHRFAELLGNTDFKNLILNAPLHLITMSNRLSRNISPIVLSTTLDIPEPTARLKADWERDIVSQLCIEVGDVEELSLVRTRLRWDGFDPCVQTMANWTHAVGLQDALSAANIALMACRGARYHNDADQYGEYAFCNLFLSEDKGLDLHFPNLGLRIPLTRGTAVIFDTGQTHAVIKRSSNDFDESDFPAGNDCSLVFLTWELPIESSAIEQTGVAKALQIEFTPPSQISPNF
jgi:hypothetical protein